MESGIDRPLRDIYGEVWMSCDEWCPLCALISMRVGSIQGRHVYMHKYAPTDPEGFHKRAVIFSKSAHPQPALLRKMKNGRSLVYLVARCPRRRVDTPLILCALSGHIHATLALEWIPEG
jgi:hypothetical protein